MNDSRISDDLLHTRVSDYHIAEIADDLVEWELLAPYLGLTQDEQKEILDINANCYKLQKIQALKMWRWKSGDKATYRNLSSICHSQGLVSLAKIIEGYPGSKQQLRNNQVLHTFQRYLFDCYLSSSPPTTLWWPETNHSLSLCAPSTFFDLNLKEAPLIKYSPTMSQSSCLTVTLTSIFAQDREPQRLLVYFQGNGGSGKTMLSWYICKEWANKRLLNQFQLLIHVQLSNPQLKLATNFADIIPYPDRNLQQAIARVIIDHKGLGIGLLLDGLSEAPTDLLNFLLVDLLQGRLQLPELSIVMMSRPDWRVIKQLKNVFSSCILLAGFSRESLSKYLDHRLGIHSEENQKLQEEFRINRRTEDLCCYPINAAIICHVIHFINTVQTTQTKLHDSLIKVLLTCQIKSHLMIEKPCAIDTLLQDQCLPSEICKSFRRICLLAYISILQQKQQFTKEDLEQADIQDTLGLLHTHLTMTSYGLEQYHSFYNISIQEFLTAVHLSTLKEIEQVTIIRKFLRNNLVQSEVLSFYAGLTNLSNIKAFKTIREPLSQVVSCSNILRQILEMNTDPRRKVITFCKCLYECQNESLMKIPETDLRLDQSVSQGIAELHGIIRLLQSKDLVIDKALTLHGLILTPLDCLSLGYYLRYRIVSQKTLVFNLSKCSIKGIGISLLLTEMTRNIPKYIQSKVTLCLNSNQFDEESLLSLKKLLQEWEIIECLGLDHCFDADIVDRRYALKCLIEGLADNNSCKSLNLSANSFDTSHIYHIILMLLTCSQIKCLILCDCDLSKSISLFSHTVSFTSLTHISIGNCNISDSGLQIMGEKVKNHNYLIFLGMPANNFTLDGLCRFLHLFKNNHYSKLVHLDIDHEFRRHDRIKQILKEINDFRTALPHPHNNLITYSITDNKFVKTELASMQQLQRL